MRVIHPQTLQSATVFASPHSGRDYHRDFMRQSVLNAQQIRTSEDAFVDQIYGDVPSHGAPLLLADVPRAFVDLNRDIAELDSALIDDAPPLKQNPRVAAGLGVIPRVVADGRAIYRGKMPLTTARDRLNNYWFPYHAALKNLLDQAHECFGQAILIDCHSMPASCVANSSVDIVLGDRFGASVSGAIMDQIESLFAAAGFRVARNAPFAGAFSTRFYGRPATHQHAVQIEINRALYMDENTITLRPDFDAFCAQINPVIAGLVALGRRGDRKMAAE